MKIGFATADWSLGNTDPDGVPTFGGAGWYRIGMPSAAIAQHTEHEVVKGVLVDNGKVLGVLEWPKNGSPETKEGSSHFDCDIVVIQRYMNDNLPEAIKKATAAGQIIINDVDDWFWGLSPSNQAFKHSHPKFNPTANINHYQKTLGASSLITTSTPYLASRIQSIAGDVPVEVIRNAIDCEMFAMKRTSHVPPVVGWIGGTPWRSKDLETLRGVLGPWCLRNKWRFYHGGDYPESQLSAAKLAGIPDEVITSVAPLVSILEYPSLFEGLDLGVVPLTYCPFNESKSAIKGMEYAAAGIPFIAAATGEYKWLAGQMNIGRTAKRPSDWIRNLEVLSDSKVRAKEAISNKEAVQRLDINKRYIDWTDVYKDALSRAL